MLRTNGSGRLKLRAAAALDRSAFVGWMHTDLNWSVAMNISAILAELRAEREQLEEAILSLERLAAGTGKRRGRPPAWMVAAKQTETPKRRGRPPGSGNKGTHSE